jgi:tetratricopeptide (TPR) repeat protein
VQIVGIIQEQHPDRARLFMQWKQMDWPILIDSLNLQGVAAVPITLAIDEYGIIRAVNPERESIETSFLSQSYPKPPGQTAAEIRPPDLKKLKAETSGGSVSSWRDYADAIVMWGADHQLGDAIAAYEKAISLDSGQSPTYFRLGVAYRKRYESSIRKRDDFQKAVEHWMRALEMDPNQYIWRRRIQQYGPRLDKPYPFYDWVTTARQDIQARGEKPTPLLVEPGGSELASPLKAFAMDQPSRQQTDAQGRVLRDKEGFISTEVALVPPAVPPGASTRVHLAFRPNLQRKAHWNNEAEDLVLWVDAPPGWQVSSRYLTVPNPKAVVSQEIRNIEFELKCPEKAQPGSVKIPAYALYYVCEDVNGTCLYRRQDVGLEIRVRSTR